MLCVGASRAQLEIVVALVAKDGASGCATTDARKMSAGQRLQRADSWWLSIRRCRQGGLSQPESIGAAEKQSNALGREGLDWWQ